MTEVGTTPEKTIFQRHVHKLGIGQDRLVEVGTHHLDPITELGVLKVRSIK